MRIGIFGGSFDPPHNGHLLVAMDAIDALSLDRLLVVPAGVQPLKTGQRTSSEHRLAMTRQCFDGLPRVEVDPIEIERGGLSFSVDTVEAYRRQWPSAELHLLLGEDAVAGFARWREPERLLSMAQLVVLSRRMTTAATQTSSTGGEWISSAGVSYPVQRLETRRVDVSSTEIRARVNEGRSIRGFVPDAVAAYIAAHNLYLQAPAALGDPTPA
ncbi:MAG: nicotinate (nicotinamide) nucleotide adenylyltransferase [Gemmatimonadaceae bacterium]